MRLSVPSGLAALARAEGLGPLDRYGLQAAIAACHARALAAEETDWAEIARLYGELARLAPSPVVELNRAVAIAEARGPAAGLALIEAIDGLDSYRYLHSARGELLARLGRTEEARRAFERALELIEDEAERRLIARKLAAISR